MNTCEKQVSLCEADMALIIDKSCIQKPYQPMLGEIVRMGAREGIYVGKTRNVHQVLVQWREMGDASVVPASFLSFTGELDGDFVERCYAIDSPGHKGKGGLKTGGRRIKRTKADIAFKRQEIRRKKISKGTGPGSATDEGTKSNNSVEKNSHMGGKIQYPCLGGCGKFVPGDVETMEPFYCESCQKRMGFFHVSKELK